MDNVNVNVWQDRTVKFDIYNIQNQLHAGEEKLDIMDYIEDTKGNPRDGGRLIVTNLRIIWYSLNTNKFNVSVGMLCINSMTTKTVLSKLRGTTQALHILASYHNSRFEFIFTNMALDNTRQFPAVFAIYRLYQSSVLYRELKLRTGVVAGGQLRVLPREQIINTVPGIWNLSSDQGNLGTFVLTNVRLVWFAKVNEMFNISLPYMQIAAIRVRDSKYGPALVINTLPGSGGYVLGFRVDPSERLKMVFQEISSLYSIYGAKPVFGVFYEKIQESPVLRDDTMIVDDIEELDTSKSSELNTKLSSYLADDGDVFGQRAEHRAPFYCKDLGFAMEKIKDGYTLADLWDVVPSTTTNNNNSK